MVERSNKVSRACRLAAAPAAQRCRTVVLETMMPSTCFGDPAAMSSSRLHSRSGASEKIGGLLKLPHAPR
jgi:hypothetical protein